MKLDLLYQENIEINFGSVAGVTSVDLTLDYGLVSVRKGREIFTTFISWLPVEYRTRLVTITEKAFAALQWAKIEKV